MTIDAVRKGLTLEQAEKNEGQGAHEVNTELEVEAMRRFPREPGGKDSPRGVCPGTSQAGG